MIGDHLQKYTYEYLLAYVLGFVSQNVDKREGAIIYDTSAATMYALELLMMSLQEIYINTDVMRATGEYLDNIALENGVTRLNATYAIKLGYFTDANDQPVEVPLGSRFATISSTNPVNYAVTAPYVVDGAEQAGYYELTCETSGVIGNEYTGTLVNISFIQGIASAQMLSLIIPARDTETDDELRERILLTLGQKAFGGNITDYREKVGQMDGVGALQIYPIWAGGGTVKLSVVDPQYNPASPEFIHELQVAIDPENASGETGTGLGIAPIGHKVTVTTPTALPIDVVATVQLDPNVTIGQVVGPATTAIDGYINTLKQSWGDPDQFNRYYVNVYRAQIISLLVQVNGIANVTSVTLNGQENDLSLTQTGLTQELPVAGTVTLNES